MLRRIFQPVRKEGIGGGDNYIMASFVFVIFVKYLVIHKSVKYTYLKSSQQINYARGHDNSDANKERNSSSIFFFKKTRTQSCRAFPLGSIRITAAVPLVDRDMLTSVWGEKDYFTDVCSITKGGHIEHL
jgi:phage-related protein